MTAAEPPLAGLTVLDLSVWGIGSLASVSLADLGADVIKIEAPSGDPGRALVWTAGGIDCTMAHGRNAFFETFNRGKRGIVLDLKQEAGRDLLKRLALGADVLVENFRPGVAARFGIDYEELRAANPRLVYASATGYGPLGPDRLRPGLDYVGQARSGYMWTMGREGDDPAFHTIGAADAMGAIMLTQGVLAALAKRGITGLGSRVETSHLGAMIWLQYWNAGVVLFTESPGWGRRLRADAANPLWNHYRCADDRWVALALLQPDRFWPSFCELIDRPELRVDPRFATYDARAEHCVELIAILDEVFATRPSKEWLELLGRDPDFVFEVVQTVTDLATDAQVLANDYVVEVDYPPLGRRPIVRLPFHFDGQAPLARRPAPALGEHTWEVLAERLGLDGQELEALALASAIG